jgi:MFS family permease
LALFFERDFTEMALLTGYHLCGVGVAGFIFVASARVWGKRHLYLLGTILIIISSAWGGSVGHSYKSLLWARVLQGVGLAPFEALVNASVGDLYFVHERGKRMALSNMALFGGAFFTPILVGKITHTLGWQWSFYFIAIFAGAMLPLIFFFVPETAYRRADYLNTDVTGEGDFEMKRTASHVAQASQSSNGETAVGEGKTSLTGSGPVSFDKNHADTEARHLNSHSAVPAKVSYARTLLPFNGRKTDDNFFKLILRPFPLFLHPAILWGCLIQGTLIGWTVLIGVVLAAIYLGPPFFFNEVTTGYMYTGAFVGAVLGFLLAGLLADWSTNLMIRRNKGVYEPEFRIVLVFAQFVIGCAGLYGFGITSSNLPRYGWFLPDFFFALEVMGMVIGAVASALYIVDSHSKWIL